MIFKKFPIVYSSLQDENGNYLEFRENMSTTFNEEPFDKKEIVIPTYINVVDLIVIVLRPVLANDGTIIETQTLLEHGDNYNRSHWVVDLPIEETLRILNTNDENILDV